MRAPLPWKWLGLFVAVKLAVTLAVAGRYGWHRDELYYLASSRHLALGYVDYPPIVPFLAWADQLVARGSLVGLRVLPAAAGAVVILLTALIARELGAGSRAQAWAGFTLLVSPMYVGGDLMFQTVAFDQLTWAVALLILVRLLRDGDQRLWILYGLAVGVGLETKFTLAALPVVTFAALLVSGRRALLRSPWPWIGAGLALVILAPNLWWQVTHDWISVQYTISHHGRTDGPVAYWLQQLLLFGPLFIPSSVAGLWALRRDSRFATLLYLVVGVELLFFVVGGKAYYPAPVYPVAYAAGAIWLDARLVTLPRRLSFATAVVALILVLLPIGLPALPASTMASLNLWQARKDYADMVGWPELAQATAAAYDSLPPDQRAHAVILAQNYGEAGAVDYYGPALGLPSAVSGHLTFWYWAPRDLDPGVVVMVGYSQAFAERYFTSCRETGTVTNDLGIHNEEYGAPVLICAGPREPLSKVWRDFQLLD